MRRSSVQPMVYASFLIALGILIPIMMPVRIVIGPASYTLGSHIPVMLAMFISPKVAVMVALGTAFGFFLTAPFIIVMRAFTHVVFAYFGALYLEMSPQSIQSNKRMWVFNVVLGVLHAACEVLVVTIFFMMDNSGEAVYTPAFFQTVIVLVGFGGFIHSLIDFSLSLIIARKIGNRFKFPTFLEATK